MAVRLCSHTGCFERVKARRLCNTHYQSWIRNQKRGSGYTQTEIDSFWSKVDKTDNCWLWTAGTGRGGYGIISVAAYPVKAHRFSWMLHNGVIPEKMGVLHTCDNPLCVNPKHLFLGTSIENTKDRDSKNRQCQGERHHDSKLTADDVKEIREAR